MDEDYINELCERADYYGMEALTEEEQYLVNHKNDFKNDTGVYKDL